MIFCLFLGAAGEGSSYPRVSSPLMAMMRSSCLFLESLPTSSVVWHCLMILTRMGRVVASMEGDRQPRRLKSEVV